MSEKIMLRKISENNPQYNVGAEDKERLKEGAKQLLKLKGAEDVTVYYAKNERKNFRTAKKNVSVFVGTAPGETDIVSGVVVTTEAGTFALDAYYLSTPVQGIDEFKVNGVVMAYVSIEGNEIYIPYNLEVLESADVVNVTVEFIAKVKTDIYDEIQNINSWVNSKQKDSLKERIARYFSKNLERRAEELGEEIRDLENRIEELQRSLKERYDSLIKKRQMLEDAKEHKVHGLDGFLAGLDTTAQHPLVENVEVFEKTIKIYTAPLQMDARIDGEVKKFHLGKATIDIDIDSSTVRFGSNNPRQGYWTRKDPHPHVDGSNGRACLGNVANSIAQLASDREIYALFLICLDFLQNANTADSAGRKVTSWDEVK